MTSDDLKNGGKNQYFWRACVLQRGEINIFHVKKDNLMPVTYYHLKIKAYKYNIYNIQFLVENLNMYECKLKRACNCY